MYRGLDFGRVKYYHMNSDGGSPSGTKRFIPDGREANHLRRNLSRREPLPAPRNSAMKSPSFPFYVKDHFTDTARLTLKAKGAWITILCHLYLADRRGKMRATTEEWASIFGADKVTTECVLNEIKIKKVGSVTFCHGDVTVSCRRMVREEKIRKIERIRQKRHRGKLDNASVTPPVTPKYSAPASSFATDCNRLPLQDKEKDLPPENPGGVSPDSRKKRGRPKLPPDPRVKKFIDWFCVQYEKEFGRKYVVCGGKDGLSVKRVIRALDREGVKGGEVLATATAAMFKDEFWREKSGLSVLAGQINVFRATKEKELDSNDPDFLIKKYEREYGPKEKWRKPLGDGADNAGEMGTRADHAGKSGNSSTADSVLSP